MANSELCLISEKLCCMLQKYLPSFDTEVCSHCAEADPRKHTDPVQHVNVDEAVTKRNIQ